MKPESVNNNSIPDAIIWKSLANLIERFKLTEAEGRTLMGSMARSSYHKGLSTQNVRLNRDQRDRVSYLLGIYKALRILFMDSEQAMSWIDRPNELQPFNSMTPRQYMMEGSLVRLAEVRRFLDFWRGY